MTGILVVSLLTLVVTLVVQGFNLWTVAAVVTTLMFMGRKIGYFCKLKHLLVIEVIALVVTVGFQIVLQRFRLAKFILILLIRAVFMLVALYDTKMYVYYTEKRRRH